LEFARHLISIRVSRHGYRRQSMEMSWSWPGVSAGAGGG